MGNSRLASMSKRGYLSRDIAVTPEQEETPVSIRIQGSSATVKAVHSRLQQAYLKDEVRLVRRLTVVIDLRVHHGPVAVLHARWGLRISCLSPWRQAFRRQGMASWVYHQRGGR